jgi:hypothetical protein
MRIPFRKIYRAFPELDRFDDERCERYVLQATQVALGRRVRRHLLEAALGVLVFGAIIFAGILTARLAGSRLFASSASALILLGYYSLLVALPIIASLMARDWWLRRAVGDRLRSARCPGCEYSLLGLPVQEDSVRCPECGTRFDLVHHGLTVEDVLGHPEASAVTSS